MVKTSQLDIKAGKIRVASNLKGGEMNIANTHGGALKGGFKKGSASKTHKGEKDFTTKKGDKDFHRDGHDEKEKGGDVPFQEPKKSQGLKNAIEMDRDPRPRELRKEVDRLASQGAQNRSTIDSTRDALLMGILTKLENGEDVKAKEGDGIRVATLSGGGITSLEIRLGNIVKNKRRLNHLKEMGINLESYSPYLVKAVVDGDYRSFRTTNKQEWDRMINESAIKGVLPSVMGTKTQFGQNLAGFLTNGKYGGALSNTDYARNKEIGVPTGQSVVTRAGLEGGSLVNVSEPAPPTEIITTESVIEKVLDLSVNTGYNVALDYLNASKRVLTKGDYNELYVYLGQNSLPLR